MKIHIVQKGDTLWELAKEYGVDFNELKEANAHLSSPDMIMPGMKIKIPSSSKQVKKKTTPAKEAKKQVKAQQQPFSPKPLAVKEDDHLKKKEVKKAVPKQVQQEAPMMPVMPQIPQVPPMVQMPLMEQQVQQSTTINIEQEAPKPVKEKVIEKKVKEQPPKKQKVKKPVKEKVKSEQHAPQMMPIQHVPIHYQPMPMCCHVMPSCCCHHHGHYPMMHHMFPNNCYDMDLMHMHMSQQMGPQMCHCSKQQENFTDPNLFEEHKGGFYNMQQGEVPVAPYGNDQYNQTMQQQSQPYPPFYRNTPESPPNPTPPNIPSMPEERVEEQGQNSE